MSQRFKLLISLAVIQLLYWAALEPMLSRVDMPADLLFKSMQIAPLDEATLDSFDVADFEQQSLPWTGCCEYKAYGLKYNFEHNKKDKREHDLGLIVSIAADNYHVYVNHQAVFTPGSIRGNISFHANQTSVIRIPQGLLNDGNNQLQIISARGANPYTDVFPFFLGDYQQLSERASWRLFVLNDYSLATGLLALFIALIMFVAALQIRNKAYAYWLALLALFVAARTGFQFWFDIPLNAQWRLTLGYFLSSGVALSWYCFTYTWCQAKSWLTIRIALLLFFVCLIVNTTSWQVLNFQLAYQIHDWLQVGFNAGIFLATLYILFKHIHIQTEERNFELALFALCVSAYGVDVLQELFWQRATDHGEYTTPFLLLGLMVAFTSRNVHLYESTVVYNQELEEQLAEKEQALRDGIEHEASLKQQQAVVEERQRIMRDMHDGIGGSLFSLATQLKQNTINTSEASERLYGSLDELRMIVDSLDTAGQTLAICLGALRSRIQPRYAAADIKLHWCIDEDAAQISLPASDVLHVFLFLQEASSNVLQHSHATEACLSLTCHERLLEVTFTDNGVGFSGDERNSGHGIKNMKTRARAVNGSLVFVNSEKNHGVSLRLPCDP